MSILWLIIGLGIGVVAGIMIVCLVTSNRHYELCEALDRCRIELSWYAPGNGEAMAACANATRVLNDNGWQTAKED